MKKLFTIFFLIIALGWCSDAFAAHPDRSKQCMRTGKNFSGRVATCTKAIFMSVLDQAASITLPVAEKLVYLAILLSITLFGAKMATGGINLHQIKGHLILLALKIGLVLFIVTQYDKDFGGIPLYEIPIAMLDYIVYASTNWIEVESVFSPDTKSMCEGIIGTSPANMIGPLPAYHDGMSQTWWNFDCMTLMTLGADKVAKGVLGVVGVALAFTSMAGLGWLLISIVVFLIWTILCTVFKGIFVYIRAIISLTILIIMTPLFLPFAFFSQTKGYLDELFEVFIETIFQPAIYFAIISIFVIFLVDNGGPLESMSSAIKNFELSSSCNAKSNMNTNSTCLKKTNGEKALDKMYRLLGLVVACISPLILATAMIGFANHAEQLAGFFARTPADAMPKSFQEVAPAWVNDRVDQAVNRFTQWKGETIGREKIGGKEVLGRRGGYGHREFKSEELKRDYNLDLIDANSGLSTEEKATQRRAVKDDYRETVADMKRANQGKTNIMGATGALLYESVKGVAKGAWTIEKERGKGFKGSAKEGYKKLKQEIKSSDALMAKRLSSVPAALLYGAISTLSRGAIKIEEERGKGFKDSAKEGGKEVKKAFKENMAKVKVKEMFAGGMLAKYRREIITKRLKTKDITDDYKKNVKAINDDNTLLNKEKREMIEVEKKHAEKRIEKRRLAQEKGSKRVQDGWAKAVFKKHWFGNTDKDI